MSLASFIVVVTFAVLAHGAPSSCPEPYGEQAYAHPDHCDQFFLCTNGTLTLETCENGLLFDGRGAVHNHCNYNWAVECGERKIVSDQNPINLGVCEYAFGIYEASASCSTSYIKCAHGEAEAHPCQKGLVYDERIHGCNWPDLLQEKCDPESVIGFRCPSHVDPKDPAYKFWPFPRFAVDSDPHSLIICNEGHPRVISCGEDKFFDRTTLTCEDS